MGHDITAYKNKKQIASMRRTDSEPQRKSIYVALSVEPFFKNCSGSGDEKLFTKKELEIAKQSLELLTKLDHTEELEFLDKCLKHVNSKGILINFA